MKVFLDANVLVSVLNKEYPVYSYSSRILTLQHHRNFKTYTSPLCMAIAFYFSEKKSGRSEARKKLTILSQNIGITSMNEKTVKETMANKKVLDLEDGFEYYSAVESGCKCIISEDRDDFYFSDIEVMNCKDFFESYIKK